MARGSLLSINFMQHQDQDLKLFGKDCAAGQSFLPYTKGAEVAVRIRFLVTHVSNEIYRTEMILLFYV